MDKIGIFDPEGVNKNPLTGEPYSDRYKELGKLWSKFPAYEKAQDIVKAIRDNQVLLIISGTGSGKTVLTPKLVLHTMDYKGTIITTLPKRMVAKSNAEFAAETLDVKLGTHVGYQYKGSPREAKSKDTKLLYATDGSVVARLLNDPKLEGVDAVIIDEAHERKVQIDFLLYLLKNTLELRPEFKVVIMSATVNAEIFANYFSKNSFKEINIGGKTNYPIESIFLTEVVEYNTALDKGFDTLVKILKDDDPTGEGAHDILFFITSKNEAFDMCKRLDRYIKDLEKDKCVITCKGTVFCVEVYSGMDSKKEGLAQDRLLYRKDTKHIRKVVLATNVAESSITIDGIKFVIDSGRELKGYYDPKKRANVLGRQLITQAQAKQRMGRSGRTEPGVCYHLYTKEDFDKNMGRFPEPDIRVSDISGECLRLLNLDKVGTVDKLLDVLGKLIEPPKEEYIRDALTKLMQLGCTTSDKITTLGSTISKISTDPMVGKTLVYSKLCRCSNEVVNIMATLDACNNNLSDIFTINQTVNNIKKRYRNDRDQLRKKVKAVEEEFKKIQKRYKHKYGDHLSILSIYDKFSEYERNHRSDYSKMEKYCNDRFLKLKTLLKARRFARKLSHDLRRHIYPNNDQGVNLPEEVLKLNVDDRIMYCFLQGYTINRATNKGRVYRLTGVSNEKADVDKMSFIKLNKKLPKHIIFNEYFIMEGKGSLNVVSKVPTNIDRII